MLDSIPALRMCDVLHKSEATDTIVRFVMRDAELEAVGIENNCLKVKGTWDVTKFTSLTKKSAYKTATSYDLTEVEKIGRVPVLDNNPNALYYVADDSEATGYNVVRNGLCEQLVVTPGYTFAPREDFQAKKAVMNLNMPACSWGLITVPCDVEVPAGIFARQIDNHISSGISNRTTNVTSLTAGHTYLVMTSSKVKQQLIGTDAHVAMNVAQNPDTAVVGTYTTVATPDDAMIPNSETHYFMFVDQGTEIEALRGYFLASNVSKEFRAYSSIAVDPVYQTLCEQINTAYGALSSNSLYAPVDSTIALQALIDSAEVMFTQRTAIGTDVRIMRNQLAESVANYLAVSPNPMEEHDYTSYIVNPSFEQSVTGWTTDGLVKKNSDLTYMSVGVSGSAYLFNCKSDSSSTRLSQTLTGLRKGYYRLTAMVGSTEGHSITMFAGDSTVVVESSPLGVHYLVEARIDDIYVDDSGELEIGVSEGFFYKVDDFRLTLTAFAEDIIAEDVNGDGTVDTQDVLCIYEHIQNAVSDADISAVDVNGDGMVDTQDVLKIYEYIQSK